MAFEDVPEMVKCLTQLNSELDKMSKHMQALKDQVASQNYSAKDGVDLLALKNQLLLSYMTGLNNVVLLKTQGVRDIPLSKKEVVGRLVEDRVVLEKLKPLEAKFSYQLDKLLRTASTGLPGGEHPLQFRPAPHSLVSKVSKRQLETKEDGTGLDLSDMEVEEEEEENREVYVPPRVLAMPYKEDEERASLKRGSTPEQRRLLSELRNEWSDLPAEMQTNEEEDGQAKERSHRAAARERESFEEDYLVRVPGRKAARDGRQDSKARQISGQITDFTMLRTLTRQGKRSSKARQKKVKTN